MNRSEAAKKRWANPEYRKINKGNTVKGRAPWNKGLTKDNDDRIKKYGIKLRGRSPSEETRKKISKSLLAITRHLEYHGYIVLRFWETDINTRLDWCINRIIKVIK